MTKINKVWVLQTMLVIRDGYHLKMTRGEQIPEIKNLQDYMHPFMVSGCFVVLNNFPNVNIIPLDYPVLDRLPEPAIHHWMNENFANVREEYIGSIGTHQNKYEVIWRCTRMEQHDISRRELAIYYL